MFCQACGNQIQGSAFCSNCGAAVGQFTAAPIQHHNGAPAQAFPASAQPVKNPNTLSTLGIIFGSVAVIFFPIVFGLAGIVMSAIAKSKAEPKSNLALGISIGGTLVGFIFGAFIAGF